MDLIGLTPQGQVRISIADEPLGRGGEGSVFAVREGAVSGLGPNDLVAKLYHEPHVGNREQKIRAMAMAPPQSDSVAWPIGLLYRTDRVFQGFLMRRLPSNTYRPWAELAHAGQRRSTAHTFDVRYGLTAARNFAAALATVHAAGHRVGDINESNLAVGVDASVFIVDTDSAQIQGQDGQVFSCLVGKPEYTAPELQSRPFAEQTRTEASDAYGFGVMVYQMMTGGAHPTDGVVTQGEMPSVGEKIRGGIYPGLKPSSAPSFTHPARIPVSALGADLRGLILACLAQDSSKRPSAATTVQVLDSILFHLTQCSEVKEHWYDRREAQCGWCEHSRRGQPDPWSSKRAAEQLPAQVTLPPVTFGEAGEVQIRRAAPSPVLPPQAPAPRAPSHPSGTPASSPPASPPPSAAKKHKGKSILNYADGTQGPRPPMGMLFKANPRLALACARDETPDAAKFWWPAYRDVATVPGLTIGVVVGVVFAVVWTLFLESALGLIVTATWAQPLLALAAAVAGAGTAFTSTFLFVSGLRDRSKAQKQLGPGQALREESPTRTPLRFVGLGLVYGPLLVAGLVGLACLASIQFVAALLKENTGPSYR